MYEYMVTDVPVARASVREQERILNENAPLGWELVCCDDKGRYIMRRLV